MSATFVFHRCAKPGCRVPFVFQSSAVAACASTRVRFVDLAEASSPLTHRITHPLELLPVRICVHTLLRSQSATSTASNVCKMNPGHDLPPAVPDRATVRAVGSQQKRDRATLTDRFSMPSLVSWNIIPRYILTAACC